MSDVFCSLSVNTSPLPGLPGRGLIRKMFLFSHIGRLRFLFVSSLVFNVRFVFFLLFLLVSYSYSQQRIVGSQVVSSNASHTVSPSYPFDFCELSASAWCRNDIFGTITCWADRGGPSNTSSGYSLPSGCSADSTFSFWSGSCSGSGQNLSWITSCQLGANNCTVSLSASTIFYYSCPSGTVLPLPQCSEFLPVPAPACKGGQGLWFRTSGFSGYNKLIDMFGTPSELWNDGISIAWEFNSGSGAYVNTSAPGDSLRPDGSKCSPDNTSGAIGDFVICPQGFADDFSSSSSGESSSASAGSSGSSAGSSADSNGDSSNSSCVCVAFVDGECSAWFPFGCQESSGMSSPSDGGSSSDSNCYCLAMVDKQCHFWSPGCGGLGDSSCRCVAMINGDCKVWDPPGCNDGGGEGGNGGGSIGGEGDGEGGGISCKMLNNCDWAKFGTQLQQLGVEVQIRDAVKDMLKDLKDGKSLSGQQLGVLRGILDALNGSGGGNGSAGSGGGGSSGSGGNASAGSGWPGGTCDPRVSDCTHVFTGEDGDTTWGVAKGYLDNFMSDHDLDSASLSGRFSYSRILRDTTKIFPGMRRAITPFNNYIHSTAGGCNGILDFSFTIGGFSCGQTCMIDMTNFGGYPVAKMATDLLTIVFGLGVLIRLLYVVRAFGQGG